MRTLFLASFLLITTTLFAECASCHNQPAGWMGHRGSCSPSPLPRLMCNGYWEVFGEALYLRPTTCDLGFAINDPRTIPNPGTEILSWLPQGKGHSIDPDHDWGSRIGIGLLSGCGDVRAVYTRLHTRQSADALPKNNGGIWVTYAHPATAQFTPGFNPFVDGTPTDGIPTFATASIRFDYDAVDLQWGSRALLKCELALRSALGLHFAYIDSRFADYWQGTEFDQFPAELFTEIITNRSRRKSWGVGPAAGLDVHYPLACGFGFEGHLGAALLVGSRSETREGRRLTFLLPDTLERDQHLDVKTGNRNGLVPYLTARLGLDYLWCCECRFTLQLAFGYEFETYINAIEAYRYNDRRATGQTECSDFSLNGLYLRVRVII
ncbi:MAG: Lpg1974 family pore-forming outer membrane protein [Parachlamydiales bacterium]